MAKPKSILDQFKKGAGEAPQYSVLANTTRPASANYVQNFDGRAIMQEEPPTIAGGPKGSPKRDALPRQIGYARRLIEFDDETNIRADGQVLVRATPTSSKADRDTKARRLGVYHDASGEGL